MSTRADIKTNVRVNLADLGVTFYSEDDLNDSIQDAYDDIALASQCILKTTTIAFQNQLSYYNFKTLGVDDYLATTAIFNQNSNLWLRDDMSRRDFDRIRRDWEIWEGQPQFWAPSDPDNVIIVPRFLTASGSFDLYYWAVAPVLSGDSDTFLVATDMQNLFEFYVTGDMLEQAQEYQKASIFWNKYYPNLADYSVRVKQNCKSDLLMRV